MNKYTAEVDVMPLKALLDPQGKAVTMGLNNMGFQGIEEVRVGKHITLHVNASDKNEAEKKVKEACEKLLANPIMESFHYHITETR